MYNLFKFIEDKRPEYKVPFKLKLIHDPESITKEELNIKGNLWLSNTPIQSLPKGLKVKGNLDLIGSLIQSLPDGLEVGGHLDLVGTPLSKKYTTEEELKAKYPDLKVGGKIYI